MSDERKGAVLTASVPTESQLDNAAYMTADAGHDGDCRACYKPMTVEPGDDPTPMCNDCAQLFLIEDFPSILDGARLARIASGFFEEHGDSLVAALALADEVVGDEGDDEEMAEAEQTRKALESTIAAFRKGAE